MKGVLAQYQGALPEQRIFSLDRRVHFNAVLVSTVFVVSVVLHAANLR